MQTQLLVFDRFLAIQSVRTIQQLVITPSLVTTQAALPMLHWATRPDAISPAQTIFYLAIRRVVVSPAAITILPSAPKALLSIPTPSGSAPEKLTTPPSLPGLPAWLLPALRWC